MAHLKHVVYGDKVVANGKRWRGLCTLLDATGGITFLIDAKATQPAPLHAIHASKLQRQADGTFTDNAIDPPASDNGMPLPAAP